MISKLDNRLGIFLWCLCLFTAIEACFTPVQLPTPRSGVCIVESNGKVYFAGGDDASGQALPMIDIYDMTTDTWSRLWLQTARFWMRCNAVGDYVVFAFGYRSRTGADVYSAADILDTRSQTMTTVNLPSIGWQQTVHVFGQYVAYHYIDQFVFLDPATGALKSTSIWLNLSVSNSTHLFGVSARNNMLQIYPFDLDTLSVKPEPSYNISMRISAFGLPTLHLLEGQLVIRDISELRVYSFGAEPPDVIEIASYVPSTVSTVYGSTLYFIGPSFIVTYSKRAGFISYSVPAMGFTPLNLPAAVSHGILYLSGDAGLTTTACIVLNGLVQHSIGTFKFRRRDIGLSVSSQAGEFAWLNLHTRQVRRQQMNRWVSDEFVELDEYWVFPGGILFHIPTETWTSFPSPLLQGRVLSTALQGTVAVFMHERRDFRIFNVTDQSWRELSGPGFLPTVITAVRNKIITLSSMGEIDVLDVVTSNRTSFQLGVVGPSFVTTDDLFILAAIWNTSNVPIIPADTVVIYNAVTDTFQFHRLAVAGLLRALVQSKTHVFFVTATFIIDIYNIAEGRWSRTNIPYHFNDAGLEAVTALSTLVIRRPQRVDLFDTSINEWRVLADAPVDALFTSMRAFGSKVLFTVERGVLIYEITSANWLRIESVPRNIQVTDSFIVWSEGFKVMYQPISALTNRLQSQSAYETQSMELDPGLIGLTPFRIGWLHNSASLNSTNTHIMLTNIQQYHNGEYSIRAVDQCNMLMLQAMQLHVITRPTFAQPLEDSISLCHKPVMITAQVNGNASFQWTINGVAQTTNVTSLSIEPDRLQCNMRHQLCLTATNPSGSNQTCGHLRLLEHDMLFDGPRPTEDYATWFMDSQVTLRTKLLDDDCTRHWWLIDGVMQEPIDSQESSIAVNISALSSFTQYAIRAQCGSSFVTSDPFTFKNVSTLTVGYLVLIIVLVFAVVLAALIATVLVRRRLKAGEVHETELQTLLTQAKSESLNRDGVSVIPATTWEWKPNDEFTYKPLDDLPCAIDLSMLSHNSRDNTVKVDTWNQSEIVFTLKSKKNKKSESTLKERLIDGLQVDIYAPQSPKYEVKVEPSSFTLRQGKTTTVTVSTLMRMTTKVKIGLVVVIEQQLVYAILEYKMASAMSTWIDLEEVEMTGDFLGGGGFGSVTRGVYRGEDVAVKRLLNQYMVEELKQEFEREITLMKDLRHPNIVQFVGASNVKDNLAILIEYAPLGSLSSVLQKTKLSYSMKLTMLLESAKALQFLHLNRVIHRDIKPQNILVFSLEPKAAVHVKLTDFGTSRFISDSSVTVTKNVGTFNYMAPEALGKNPRIDKSADIYSFALLIWELMYERQPYAQFDWQSDIENHVKSGGRLPLDRVNGVNDELIKLIEDCWHQDPASRPSASDVVQRISDLI